MNITHNRHLSIILVSSSHSIQRIRSGRPSAAFSNFSYITLPASRQTSSSVTLLRLDMGARTLRKRVAIEPVTQKPVSKGKRHIKSENLENGNLDELPHNLGPAPRRAVQTKDQGGAAAVSRSNVHPDQQAIKKERNVKAEQEICAKIKVDGNQEDMLRVPRTLRSRRPTTISPYIESEETDDESKKMKRRAVKRRAPSEEAEPEEGYDAKAISSTKPTRKPVKKTKDNPYGLTPGITPFPDWPEPSADDCEEVYSLLARVHGEAKAPDKIPAPSLEVSGCGEVPSVLDAMIRTRLSAHTSSKNSTAAFKGLVDKFGVLEEGIGKGSVNWNRVRLAPVADIIEAIKTGGLAQIKSKDIKIILQMVYDENEKRRQAFLDEKESGKPAVVTGALEKTQGQKDLEILKAEQDILSLDHIHGMHPEEAMQALTKYPGIGVKTASCVILFCLQQPSFAVDTHVHRISGWLKWIPLTATRDEAFSHLEVRIPNHLKYGLHKLFVQHGRSCIKCRANTSEGTDGWDAAECPLEDVIDRIGKRKSSGKAATPKKRKIKQEHDDSD